MTSTQKEEKVADITTEKPKDEAEDSSSDEGEHGHDHHGHEGHDHDHDHDHDHKHGDKKTNKGEKKFKKAMLKLGMKPVEGINRVTIKKAKAFFLYIDDPEVLKSAGADNTYVVFGEAKIQDFTSGLAQNEAAQLQKEKATEKGDDKPAEKKAEGEGAAAEDISEDGLDQNSITTVMDHTKCTRAEAVKALKENGGDSVTAIINLTK